MTTASNVPPTRVTSESDGKKGLSLLDQIRTVDKIRLVKKLGQLDRETQTQVLTTLAEMFAE